MKKLTLLALCAFILTSPIAVLAAHGHGYDRAALARREHERRVRERVERERRERERVRRERERIRWHQYHHDYHHHY